MTGVLLYQPRQSWRVAFAFVAALLIHFAMVAIAGMHHNTPMETVTPGQDNFTTVDVFDLAPPIDEPTQPPEDVTAPSPIPVPTDEPMFKDQRPTPPPVRQQITKPSPPITKVKSGVTSGTVSLSSVRILALSGPRPVYPYEARRLRITGSGIAIMTVDPISGSVINVVMEESTGSPVLDNAAIAAFRRWRFKPGTAERVKAPITFTMTGAQY